MRKSAVMAGIAVAVGFAIGYLSALGEGGRNRSPDAARAPQGRGVRSQSRPVLSSDAASRSQIARLTAEVEKRDRLIDELRASSASKEEPGPSSSGELTLCCACNAPPLGCWWAPPSEVRVQRLELLGINGSVCLVTRDGRFVALIRGLGCQGDVISARWIRLNVDDQPFVEAYVSTYKGNGDYILYASHELYGGLTPILKTGAVDCHNDTRVFQGGRLDVEYSDFNADGYHDVRLYGMVDVYDEKGDEPIRSYPCQKVFLWSVNSSEFLEDEEKRTGFLDER